jgi:outer membrane protein assembly factor BamB
MTSLTAKRLLSIMFAAESLAMLAAADPAAASTLRVSPGSAQRAANEVEADYTTSHVLISEKARESVSITIFFDPQVTGVESAEVFTNLNRRDWATATPNGGGVEEGISPPSGNSIAAGDDRHYYKAYPMNPVPGGYLLTLPISKTGAYRLTARYRLTSDPPGAFRWYGSEQNGQGILKRDHAIVVSPAKAKDLQLYEANPLTIAATGTAPDQRGTFVKMTNPSPAAGGPRFSLAYLKQLGVNALWLQPIHPRGIDGRQTDLATNRPFELGSPYAVKNYFAVMPLMASGFTPGSSPAANDTPQGRAVALTEFQNFVKAANAQHITVFLDVPFNHTAHDTELAAPGQHYWGNAGSADTTEIRAVEARTFSRSNEYDQRASASNIAAAPDRYDFGKWADVSDLYFGRYAALVANESQKENYKNESDWFDYSVGSEDGNGAGNGHFDQITQRVWQFFGDYMQFWLTETGYPENPGHTALDITAGIGGLRADFAQGLPPQAWEYIINRTRSRKWDFVFMAESLDGGAVTYRSNRHFDVLNENLIYAFHGATKAGDFQSLYNSRRASYGDSLVLLNTSSQDEDNYKDPYEAALRFAVNSTMYGVTMIFPGQELGLKGTIVPAAPSATGSQPFGYERFELNFGKQIPQFKTYNSMMPLWRQLDRNTGDAIHLLALYSAISEARSASPALRSKEGWFLPLKRNPPQDQIFGVGKAEKAGADPASSDTVFAFVNLAVGSNGATPNGVGFDVDIKAGQQNVFGISPNHTYNVKNIAALDPNRRNRCLWGGGRSGADVLQNGIFVSMNRVPADEEGWATAPYEAQYLKLIDTTSKNECGTAANAGAVVKHAVLTRSYDNNRTGANTNEQSLTPAAIQTRGLRRVFSLKVEGDDPNIEAQPLYVPDVQMSDGTKHDVVYLFSMSNNVRAFDANTGALLWPRPVSLGKPFVPDPSDPVDIYHINKSFGILSTPVIDRETQTIYAVNWIVDGNGNRQLKVNALSLKDGKPPPGKEQPLPIEASVINSSGQKIALSQVQKQRAALLLVPLGAKTSPQTHKMLYVATTGSDTAPQKPDATLQHHGWVVAFDVDDWKPIGHWLATPNSFGGGIWQSSQGPAADDQGNVYVVTSNGGYLVNLDGSKKDFNGQTDFAESFVKLSLESGPQGPSLTLSDWFSPFRDSARKTWTMPEVAPFMSGYNYEDQDVGTSGPVLPPGTDLLLGAGKDGVLYVLNRNNMGKSIGDFSKLKSPPTFLTFDPDPNSPIYRGASPIGNMDFKPQPGWKTHHLHGSPVYWVSAKHGPMLFAWGENAELRAFAFDPSGHVKLLARGSELASGPLATAPDNMGGMPGGMLSLSANGQNNGIVWGTAPLNGDANKHVVDGIIRAYDASDFDPGLNPGAPAKLRLLWQQAGFKYSKFCPPVVADGKLLVPTFDGNVDVYELN